MSEISRRKRKHSLPRLVSQAEHQRLGRAGETRSFWGAIREMCADPAFERADLTPEEVDSWRGRGEDRGFERPQ